MQEESQSVKKRLCLQLHWLPHELTATAEFKFYHKHLPYELATTLWHSASDPSGNPMLSPPINISMICQPHLCWKKTMKYTRNVQLAPSQSEYVCIIKFRILIGNQTACSMQWNFRNVVGTVTGSVCVSIQGNGLPHKAPCSHGVQGCGVLISGRVQVNFFLSLHEGITLK